MQYFRYCSLQHRLTLSTLVLLMVVLFILGVVLTQDASKRLMNLRITQAEFQARTLGNGSMDGLVSGDYEILERQVASSLPSKEYAYAALVRPDGIILTHTDLSLIAKQLETESERQPITHNHIYKGRPVLEAVYPVVLGQKHLANAHVAFYLDIGDGLSETTFWKIIVVLIMALIVIGVSEYFLTRHIVQPIEHLRTQVANIDLNKHIHIDQKVLSQKDEVGQLAQTFNEMSGRLISAHSKLRESNEVLEERVKERTIEIEKVNKELSASRSHIFAVMENVADCVVTITSEGLIESWNNAAKQTFGYTSAEMLGRNVSLLMPEERRGEDHSDYIKTLKEEIVGQGICEVGGQHKYGAIFPMELQIEELWEGGDVVFVATMRNITERKEMIDNLEHQANHDVLTGLHNRAYIIEEMELLIARTKRKDDPFSALLFIDLDKFKQVNDTLGHAAGDAVLIDVAKIIKGRLRDTDSAARIGGDEFVILLVDISINEVELVGNAFRKKIADYNFTYNRQSIDIGCSIGMSFFSKDIETTKDIMAQADHACYQAKKAGRNQAKMYVKEV